MSRPAQLSLMPTPRVLLRYDHTVAPPDAESPFDVGTFRASLAGYPGVRGHGKTERSALVDLAEHLRDAAHWSRRSSNFSALGQALTALDRLPRDEFVSYLEARSEEAMLV